MLRQEKVVANTFDSLDTVIRSDEEMPAEPRTSVAQAPHQSDRVKPQAFGGNLDPKTTPFGPQHQMPPSHGGSSHGGGGASHGGGPVELPSYTQPVAPQASRGAPSAEPGELRILAQKGKILVVFGCRGGAGATMLSVNVASALARAGKNVVVVDLDLQLGDVFVALDLEASTSLASLARDAAASGNIDGPALKRRLQRHDSGVYALSQTGRLDDVDDQIGERIPAMLTMLTKHFDYVIVDGVRDFGDVALSALDLADRIALVLTQDVQAVRRAARVTQLFSKLGYGDNKVQMIVNRHSSRAPVAEQEIERVLNLKVTATVRNDYPRMREALDQGSLLSDVAKGSGVQKDVDAVAHVLFSENPSRPMAAPEEEEKPGFFARLFGRKK